MNNPQKSTLKRKMFCLVCVTSLFSLTSCELNRTVWGSDTPETAVELSENREALEDAIAQEIRETLVENGPGVAVLILENGEILHAQGYGFGDIKTQQPITADTVFDLASVSKQMTAMGILILMETGELSLTDAVTEHVPDFIDPDPDNPILITDLLYHSSGLADYTGDAWQGTNEEFANLTLEDHLQWLNQQEIVRDRGSEFEYNNSGYALLALIIQRVSGLPFHVFMQTRIFEPLEMNNTVVFHRLGQVIPHQAEGYLVADNGEIEASSLPSVIAGDGNVFSSLNDLAKYDNALRNAAFIRQETLALAFTIGELDDGSPTEFYGLGWGISDDHFVEHSGGWFGTSTHYRHYINVPVTIIVLANDENYDSTELVDDIAELLEL
jgi:CubicO group peptidase (beta-lactamase class C family)